MNVTGWRPIVVVGMTAPPGNDQPSIESRRDMGYVRPAGRRALFHGQHDTETRLAAHHPLIGFFDPT